MKAETIIGPVSVEERSARPYFGIRFKTPFDGMFAVVMKHLKDLRKWVKLNQISEHGPFFVRYFHCDMKATMDVEVGFVTSSTISAQEPLKAGLLPKGRYAVLVYRGNGLRGNQALMKWAKDTGVEFDSSHPDLAEWYDCRYEAYLTDYRVEPRKLLWDVELAIKLKEGCHDHYSRKE